MMLPLALDDVSVRDLTNVAIHSVRLAVLAAEIPTALYVK